jgi:hypothetical protein
MSLTNLDNNELILELQQWQTREIKWGLTSKSRPESATSSKSL